MEPVCLLFSFIQVTPLCSSVLQFHSEAVQLCELIY